MSETINTERIYFFHTDSRLDPKGRGKRMTICCIVTPVSMTYGISRGHGLDTKKWNRRLGRTISEAHARSSKAVLSHLTPKQGVKVQFINDCKGIAVDFLYPLLKSSGSINPRVAFFEAFDRNIRRKRLAAAKEMHDIRDLERFLANFLIPVTYKPAEKL